MLIGPNYDVRKGEVPQREGTKLQKEGSTVSPLRLFTKL